MELPENIYETSGGIGSGYEGQGWPCSNVMYKYLVIFVELIINLLYNVKGQISIICCN